MLIHSLHTTRRAAATICLPYPPAGASGISPVLRQVDVSILSNDDCDAVYGIVTDKNICIDASEGKGTCNVSTLSARQTRGSRTGQTP